MRIANISLTADLPGTPTLSVYFSGCDAEPKCRGCHNPELWDFEFGFELTEDELVELVLKKLKALNLKWLALVGGEPLAPQNRRAVLKLSEAVKKELPNVHIVLFSHRTKEQIETEGLKEYVKYCDLFVLGRYEEHLATGSFPASSNQEILSKNELFQ